MRRINSRAADAAASSRCTPSVGSPKRGIAAGLLGLVAIAGSACAPAVVAGTAVLVNDEFVDNAQSAIVSAPVEDVWASAKSTMSHMTDDLLDVDEDLRTIQTYVDGALVIVNVETYKAGETRVRVAAKRYLVYSDEVAANVRDGIVRDMN